MSRWYRAYEGTVTDAKLAEVAMVVGCTRSVVIASWHAILENAACVNDGGRIDIPSRRIAAVLCEPFDAIESVLAGFETVGLVHDSAVCSWKRRQYESDNSTERSKKHRERKRNGDATLQQPDATPPKAEPETELASASRARAEIDVPSLMLRLCKAAGLVVPDPGCNFARHSEYLKLVTDWLEAGADPAALEERLNTSTGKARSLKYFDAAVRETIAAKQAQATDADRMIAQIQARKAAA